MTLETPPQQVNYREILKEVVGGVLGRTGMRLRDYSDSTTLAELGVEEFDVPEIFAELEDRLNMLLNPPVSFRETDLTARQITDYLEFMGKQATQQ